MDVLPRTDALASVRAAAGKDAAWGRYEGRSVGHAVVAGAGASGAQARFELRF